MMKNGFDLAEFAREQQYWREAHPEEARLREENKRLSIERDYYCLTRLCEWPTLAEASRIVGVHRATIGRAVDRGEIETAGVRGRWLRISPTSLRDYGRRVAARERAGHARWAAGQG